MFLKHLEQTWRTTNCYIRVRVCVNYKKRTFSVTQAAMKALSKSVSVEEMALRSGRRYFDLNTIYRRMKTMNE